MAVVLTCGHPYSGFLALHQSMLVAGLKSARPSRREQLLPEDIQHKLCVAHKIDASIHHQPVQLLPGKAWQGLSVDLFIANLEQELWGWADANSIYMLNYWRDFDPQTRFVLVYSSPEYAVAQLLRDKEVSPEHVESLFLSWEKFNAELLCFYNRNQERSILVNVEALSHPAEASRLVSVLRDRLEINLSASDDWCVELLKNEAVFRLFGASLTQKYPIVQDRYSELESATDILCDYSESQEQQIAEAYVQYQYLATQFEQRCGQSIEQDTQIAGLQQQLELQAQICEEQANLAGESQIAAQAKHLELAQENEYLLSQLHQARQAQEELEFSYLQHLAFSEEQVKLAVERQQQLGQLTLVCEEQAKLASEIQTRFTKTQSECEELKHENTNLKQDLSNVVSKLKDGQTIAQSKHAKLVQENEHTLLQLHQVQEELEFYFLQHKELSEEKTSLASERDAQLTMMQSEIDSLKNENANLKLDLNNATSKREEEQTIAQSKHAELVQENKHTLLQLYQVQEELEFYFLQHKEFSEEKASLASESDAQWLILQSEIDSLKNENATLKQESEQLQSQLHQVHQVQEELETSYLQNLELSEKQVKLVTERQQRIEQLTHSYEEQANLAREWQTHLATTQAECEHLKENNKDLKLNLDNLELKLGEMQTLASNRQSVLIQENEYLLLQLHQVQEELENYFIKYQEVMPTIPVEIDLRQSINGYNWHDAEKDGRWAGPKKSSILKLPNIKPARYQIELEVVDAMTPSILKGTKFTLNGMPLELTNTQPLSLLKRSFGKKIKYPITLSATADITLNQCNAGLELGFEFPDVISPASRGSTDRRHLAVRFKTVKLKPLP